MFMRTLKVFKNQNKAQLSASNQGSSSPKKRAIKLTLSSIKSLSETKNKYNTQFNSQEQTALKSNDFKLNKIKLLNFQNEYIKAQVKKQNILDERKQCIKQKIKDKVKERLADLIKRSQTAYNSETNIKIKNDFIWHSILEVEIKGSPLKKSLRNSITQRPELVKLEKIRKSNIKRQFLRESFVTEKPLTAHTVESSPRQRAKCRRSSSNVIGPSETKQRKSFRNTHSALDEIKVPAKKDSAEIEPWNYIQDY